MYVLLSPGPAEDTHGSSHFLQFSMYRVNILQNKHVHPVEINYFRSYNRYLVHFDGLKAKAYTKIEKKNFIV